MKNVKFLLIAITLAEATFIDLVIVTGGWRLLMIAVVAGVATVTFFIEKRNVARELMAFGKYRSRMMEDRLWVITVATSIAFLVLLASMMFRTEFKLSLPAVICGGVMIGMVLCHTFSEAIIYGFLQKKCRFLLVIPKDKLTQRVKSFQEEEGAISENAKRDARFVAEFVLADEPAEYFASIEPKIAILTLRGLNTFKAYCERMDILTKVKSENSQGFGELRNAFKN